MKYYEIPPFMFLYINLSVDIGKYKSKENINKEMKKKWISKIFNNEKWKSSWYYILHELIQELDILTFLALIGIGLLQILLQWQIPWQQEYWRRSMQSSGGYSVDLKEMPVAKLESPDIHNLWARFPSDSPTSHFDRW